MSRVSGYSQTTLRQLFPLLVPSHSQHRSAFLITRTRRIASTFIAPNMIDRHQVRLRRRTRRERGSGKTALASGAFWAINDRNTALLARRSDESLGVPVSVAHIAPSLLDLGRGVVVGACQFCDTKCRTNENISLLEAIRPLAQRYVWVSSAYQLSPVQNHLQAVTRNILWAIHLLLSRLLSLEATWAQGPVGVLRIPSCVAASPDVGAREHAPASCRTLARHGWDPVATGGKFWISERPNGYCAQAARSRAWRLAAGQIAGGHERSASVILGLRRAALRDRRRRLLGSGYRVAMTEGGKYATLGSLYELKARRKRKTSSLVRSALTFWSHDCLQRSGAPRGRRSHSVSACVGQATRCALQVVCRGHAAIAEDAQREGRRLEARSTPVTFSVTYCRRVRLRSFTHLLRDSHDIVLIEMPLPGENLSLFCGLAILAFKILHTSVIEFSNAAFQECSREPVSIPVRVTPKFTQDGQCRWSVGFPGDLPLPGPCIEAPLHTHFTLIGSRGLDVKSRSNIFTHPLLLSTMYIAVSSRSVTVSMDGKCAYDVLMRAKTIFFQLLSTWCEQKFFSCEVAVNDGTTHPSITLIYVLIGRLPFLGAACGQRSHAGNYMLSKITSNDFKGRGGPAFKTLASHQGESGSIFGGVASGFFHVGIAPRTMPLVDRFSRGSPVSPHPCIPALLHTHLASPFIGSQDPDFMSRPDLVQLSWTWRTPYGVPRRETAQSACARNIGSSLYQIFLCADSLRPVDRNGLDVIACKRIIVDSGSRFKLIANDDRKRVRRRSRQRNDSALTRERRTFRTPGAMVSRCATYLTHMGYYGVTFAPPLNHWLMYVFSCGKYGGIYVPQDTIRYPYDRIPRRIAAWPREAARKQGSPREDPRQIHDLSEPQISHFKCNVPHGGYNDGFEGIFREKFQVTICTILIVSSYPYPKWNWNQRPVTSDWEDRHTESFSVVLAPSVPYIEVLRQSPAAIFTGQSTTVAGLGEIHALNIDACPFDWNAIAFRKSCTFYERTPSLHNGSQLLVNCLYAETLTHPLTDLSAIAYYIN
ncbi:hypothetical protein PR048_015963 [Dryococelus australis]|uniref:Uncharacterized protein n=1 Tax=Dryococelus australis TaxID=614101 RepID=A0ABQ9HIY0_9NEOP|nr:hypothetical protein PR048_015963 [Dryococelus australis]